MSKQKKAVEPVSDDYAMKMLPSGEFVARTDEENTLLQRLLARQTRIETRPVMVDGKQGWEHVFTPIKKEQASE